MNGCEWHKIKADLSGFVSRGVRECEVDENGHLMFTMTDDEVIDLGRVMGVDGVSPTISAEEIEGGHKLTITDAEHPDGQEINVMNGVDGEGAIDDEHAAPDHPWSGEKTSSELNTKVDKEAGKGLSAQDFTTTLKDKLDGIEQGANKTVIVDNTTTDDATKALSAAQGKKLSDAVAAIKTISNGQWWVYVDDNPRCYHYEGDSATTNKLPHANVDVHVQFYGRRRGTAYSIRWDTHGLMPEMWACALHDDTESYLLGWGAWQKLAAETVSDFTVTPTENGLVKFAKRFGKIAQIGINAINIPPSATTDVAVSRLKPFGEITVVCSNGGNGAFAQIRLSTSGRIQMWHPLSTTTTFNNVIFTFLINE